MFQYFVSSILIFATFIGPVSAYCSKPDAPHCATGYGKFDDQYDFDRCRSEMQNYRDEVETILECQKRESQQVLNDYNEAVESFNRRARGY
jgi:hypothetical protein